MSPTLVFKDGKLVMATGSPGGSRIITVVLQIIVNVIDLWAQRRRGAKCAARPRPALPRSSSTSSAAYRRTLSRLLEEMGHKVVLSKAMGSANTIVRAPDGELTGASDLRQRGTLAVGY